MYLATVRPAFIVENDQATVSKFEEIRKAQGRENATPQEILNDMRGLREEHDARADRALRAVRMLRDRYHWRTRPDFAREAAEEEAKAKRAASGSASTDLDNDEADEDETEEQLIVEPDESAPPAPVPPSPPNAMDEDDDKPLDSDDDLFEEVA